MDGTAGDALLDMLIVDLQPASAGGGAPITVTGRASASGTPEGNLDLSRRRAEAVKARLLTTPAAAPRGIDAQRIKVVAEGDRKATRDPEWQRVDVQVGDGRAQITMAHETGHMFGLQDEYASPAGGTSPGAGTPGVIGDVPAHGQPPLAGHGLPPARVENNDGIMSVGNAVEGQHYATFLEALNAVTAPERFKYGGEGEAPFRIPDPGPFDTVPLP